MACASSVHVLSCKSWQASEEVGCLLKHSLTVASSLISCMGLSGDKPPRGLCNAQIFTRRLKKGVWDIRAIVDSGGMPSSHSALCTVCPRLPLKFLHPYNEVFPPEQLQEPALHPWKSKAGADSLSTIFLVKLKLSFSGVQAVTTAVGLEFGLASSLFAVSLCFTLITMYDATGVRYHSGAKHACSPFHPQLTPRTPITGSIHFRNCLKIWCQQCIASLAPRQLKNCTCSFLSEDPG